MQRRVTGLLAGGLLAVLAGSSSRAAELPAFDCAGPFTRGASHAGIVKQFGAGNVVYRKVEVEEGETAMRTIVFPRDPARRLEIEWLDETRRRTAILMVVREGSLWRTPEGLGPGGSLKEAVAANGRAFVLSGFGWDYEGTTLDFEGGRLDRAACRLVLRFAPRGPLPDGVDLDGDREIRSDDPAMAAADPVIYQMVIMYRP